RASSPHPSDGPICAAWVADDELRFGCAPDFNVTATRASDGDGYQLTVGARSTTLWYQSGASADALILDGTGFREQELFESSISYFRDALVLDGQGYACMISASDRATVKGNGLEGSSPIRATSCHLAATDTGQPSVLAIGSEELSYGTWVENEFDQLWPVALAAPAGGAKAHAVLGSDVVVLREFRDVLYATTFRDVRVGGNPFEPTLEAARITDGPLDAFQSLTDLGRAKAFAASPTELVAIIEATTEGERGIYRLSVPRTALSETELGANDPFVRVDVPGDIYDADTLGGITHFAALGGGAFDRSGTVYRLGAAAPEPLGQTFSNPNILLALSPTAAAFTDGRQERIQFVRSTVENEVFLRHRGFLGRLEGQLYIALENESFEICVARMDGASPTIVGCPGPGAGRSTMRHAFFSGTESSGAILYTNGDFRTLSGETLPSISSSIGSAHQGPDGTIAAATNEGVQLFDGTSWTNIGGPDRPVQHLRLFSPTEAWAATDRNTLHRFDGSGWEEIDLGFAVERLDGLAGDSESGLFIVANERLYRQRR
ncbi:MAG: hypothetical protein AAGF12_31825, partial [Myxococcota bacterium]